MMKPRLLWSCLFPLVLAFALGGCASSKPVDPKDETLSLVFGYFDMKDAPSDLEWVSLKQYAAPGEKPKEASWYSLAAKDGLFFHIGVEPGSYQVDRFGGTGGIPLLTRRPFEYDFGSRGRNRTAMRIPKPGVYFLGSHKYVNHAGKGFFQADKFEMQAAKTPGEKELLQRLIKQLESDSDLSKYTRQLRLAKQRLADL
jgi:hypothetical protein